MNSRTPLLLGLLVLVIVGGIIRAAPIASTPLWFDEADTWRSGIVDPVISGWNESTGLYEPVPMSYGKFFNWTNHFETAPLTFLLSRISCDLLGNNAEWAMRLPSLIAGILCIPAAFWLGRVVRGDAAGLITAAIVTFDPSQVDQSQQCRMYTLMMLFMLLALALTIKLVREPAEQLPSADAQAAGGARKILWIVLGICYGLLLWCTQFTVAVWVGIAMGFAALLSLGLLTGRPHRAMKQVIIGITCAFIIGLLVANVGVYRIFARALSGEVGDRPNLSYAAMAREIIVAAKDLIHLTPAGLLVYVIAAIGLIMLFRQCKTSTAILAGVALANVLILFRFLRIHHFMDGRYLTCLQPTVFVGLAVFAVGFSQVILRRGAMLVVILFIAAQAWQSTHLSGYYQQPDRYLFAHAIQQARDTMKNDETASIYPGVGVILGQYYRCPQDPSLFTGLYRMEDHMVQPTQQVPANLKATGVWLVIGMYNHEDAGKEKQKRIDTLKLIARHFGSAVDDAELDKHIQQRRVVTAHISRAGVKMTSVGVE